MIGENDNAYYMIWNEKREMSMPGEEGNGKFHNCFVFFDLLKTFNLDWILKILKIWEK